MWREEEHLHVGDRALSATQFVGELRRSYSTEAIEGHRFAGKLIVAAGLIGAGGALVATRHPAGLVVGLVVLGLMYAHVAELQHETLHGLGFRNRRLNEAAGVVLGIPMLVSFSAYQASHLRHHRYLGTERNTEFFDYGLQYGEAGVPLRRAKALAVRFLMPHHYRQFATSVRRALRRQDIPGETAAVSRRIRRDHLIIAGALAAAAALAVLGQPLVLVAWLVPLAVVTCPVHALIELPEHYWCRTDERDPFVNTRTVRTHPAVRWFVNANNLHVEHHLMPRLPFRCLPALHDQVAGHITHLGRSYPSVLRSLLGRPPEAAGRPSDVAGRES